MKIVLRKSDYKSNASGYSPAWNKLLAQLGVIKSERRGVYVVTCEVPRVAIPNVTGNIFDFTEIEKLKYGEKTGDKK